MARHIRHSTSSLHDSVHEVQLTETRDYCVHLKSVFGMEKLHCYEPSDEG